MRTAEARQQRHQQPGPAEGVGEMKPADIEEKPTAVNETKKVIKDSPAKENKEEKKTAKPANKTTVQETISDERPDKPEPKQKKKKAKTKKSDTGAKQQEEQPAPDTKDKNMKKAVEEDGKPSKKQRKASAEPETKPAVNKENDGKAPSGAVRAMGDIWWNNEVHRAARQTKIGIVLSGECYVHNDRVWVKFIEDGLEWPVPRLIPK